MKCTGKFKDDFDNLCTLKSIKYVPEVIVRSKRPGSPVQNAFILAQQQLQVQQQQHQHQQSEMSSQQTKKTTGSKVSKAATAAAYTAASHAHVDVDHEVGVGIEQTPGKRVYFMSSQYYKEYLQYSF